METALGNLVADALAEHAGCDVMLVGSGSIRVESVGPVVTLGTSGLFPFTKRSPAQVRGALRGIFGHWMRPENRNGEGECYQVNAGVQAVYSEGERCLVSLMVGGQPVEDGATYTLALQDYQYRNAARYLSIAHEELLARGHKGGTTSGQQVLEEYLRNHQNAARHVEGGCLRGLRGEGLARLSGSQYTVVQ